MAPGFTSYHTHSTWSDGRAAIRDMLAAADRLGLDEVGISDHYVVPPCPDTNVGLWSMAPQRVEPYAEEVTRLRAEFRTPVRLGLEVDYFPETIEHVRQRLAGLPLDYIIGSVHYVDRFNVDGRAEDWEALSNDARDEMHAAYWTRIRAAAAANYCDIMGHLDLPKKFGFRPAADLTHLEDAALDAIAEAGVAMELNTSGWDKPCAEPYPRRDLLERALERGIPVVLTADAHAPDELTRHFDRALRLLRDVGFRSTLRFRSRQATQAPLPCSG